MNSSPNVNMSPNTFRRLLVAHGRKTTPGVFDVPKSNLLDTVDKKKLETCSKIEQIEKESVKKAPVEPEHGATAEAVGEHMWPRKEVMMNPPLSKSKSTKPVVVSSYSFYTRPFKVHGREAWEFAMRGLGSVDTLMNRYGYVEPMWRGETYPTPTESQPREYEEKKRS